MRLLKLIVVTAIGLMVVALIGLLIERDQTKKKTQRLPSIMEIQERIGATPDGILGPQTQQLWDAAICDQYANEYFKFLGEE